MSSTSLDVNYSAHRDVNVYQIQLSSIRDNVTQVGVAPMISEKQSSVKSLEFLKEKLSLRLIENTSYNHQEKRPCEPGTRRDILREITSWIEDVSEKSQHFYWLSGEPGVGKSAITASIAKYCIDHDILGAQFFINRNDAMTTDPRVLFPSICWQLCNRFQRVAIAMEKTLRNHPTLIDDISNDQATRLFVDAIEAAVADSSRPVAIIIDALDETDPKHLRLLSQILSKVAVDLPPNAKVFISSRGEHAITKAFNPLSSRKRVKSSYLAASQSLKEVAEFMEKRIEELLEDYDMKWADWGDARMKKLSSRASGLYIWAETALKFLRDEIENKGKACFGGLLDMLTAKGMNDINQLYLSILRRTCKDGDWEYQRFRRIVGAILVRQTPLSIADMTQLLNLEERGTSEPVDLVHFVRQYRTVLVNDTKEVDGLVVPRMHKSFADFITSEWAQKFRVDKSVSHGELALRCMNQLADLATYVEPYDRQQKEIPMVFPVQLVYISQHWQTHLTRMVEPDWNNDTEDKNEYEAMDICKENDTGSLSRNLKGPKPEIEVTDLQGTMLSLAFSPDGTQIALSYNSKQTVQIMDAKTSTVIMSLVGHEGFTRNLGFSPDGTKLVSASRDCTVRIWDTRTGRLLHVLRGHTAMVFHAGFSHDDRTLVTCSDDETLRTWDTRTGQPLRIFRGHENIVRYCTFSPNDQCIASYSDDGEIFIWDVNSGNFISRMEHDGTSGVVFCPCGEHLMSHDLDEEGPGVMLWEIRSGNRLDHANSTIAPLAFVQNSEQGAGSGYINVPQAALGHKIPHVYTLHTKVGIVCGIVDRGQGAWVLQIGGEILEFVTGATRTYIV